MKSTRMIKSYDGILEIELKSDVILGLRIIEKSSKISKRVGHFTEIAKQLDEYYTRRRIDFDLKFSLKKLIFKREFGKN